ncbi:MAG: D-ala-D-ala transporter subunit [Firmicutes bacterium]|nr:D-ala-D-ala transporter subunit [Bacillota bacterium]
MSVAETARTPSAEPPPSPTRSARVWRHLLRNPSGVAGLVLIVGLILVALAGPYLVHADPLKQALTQRLKGPSSGHLFGTDQLGRDILSRVVSGARISLQVGALVLLVAMTIGVTLGAIAGYVGGIVDEIIMRVTDVFLAFPTLVLAMVISAVLGKGIYNAMMAVGLVWWPWYARLVRAQVLAVKDADFIQAARSLGASPIRIIWKHLLPSTIATITVQASLDVGYAILATAGLSFIGLGAQPPTAEWGAMVAEGRKYLTTHWWVPMFPGLAILLSVMGINLLGDALRDALDPKAPGRHRKA